MSSSIPQNSANPPSVINTDNNAPRQSGAGQSFRMSLQLPENKRLKLQQHERNKLQQQVGIGHQVIDPSPQKQLHSPVTPVNGNFAQPQHLPHQHQQHHPQHPQPQQYHSNHANPTYQQASVSRPAFEQASSSYQVHQGPPAHPHANHQHPHNQAHPQGSSYQYMQVPQQPSQQYQNAPPIPASNAMMPQNSNAGSSNSNGNNNNFQMYNLSGLPPSARPPTSSGQQGMMNMQAGNTGPSTQGQQPMVGQVDDTMDVSGSSGTRRMDNGYTDYGMQMPNSSINTGGNYNSSSATSGQCPSKPSGSGISGTTADMSAFPNASYAMGSSSISGGGSTVSGYQVGLPTGGTNSIAQPLGGIGQQVPPHMQEHAHQAQGSFSGGMGHGQSGMVDQEIFEFMKRKRWPQILMQELVGAVIWCLIPYERRLSMVGDYNMDENDDDDDGMDVQAMGKHRRPSVKDNPMRKPTSGWKVVFASPAIHELLGVKPEEAEGRDWADFIHPRDVARLLNLMQSAVENTTSSSDPSKSTSSSAPETSAHVMSSYNYEVSQARSSAYEPVNVSAAQSGMGPFVGPGPSETSLCDYVRMVDKMGKEVLFELKGHAHLSDEHGQESPTSPEENGGFDGGGIMGVPSTSSMAQNIGGAGQSNRRKSHRRSVDDPAERKVKAFWIMGRKWCPRSDGGGRMLEHFLELKLENERLKQELKDLQSRPFGSKEPLSPRSQIYATASFQPLHVTQIGNFNAAGQPKERTASADNTDDSGADDDGSDDDTPGVLRQPPQHNRVSDLQASATGDDLKKSKRQKNKNPEYLCRNCGRNDSPEWRKGPLGPKTLCNACGLRWAKKQAGPNNKRKDKEKEKEQAGRPMEGFHTMNVNTMDMT